LRKLLQTFPSNNMAGRGFGIMLFASALWCALSSAQPREYIMFIGNPGVGKSTLLNSLFQRHEFDSGPSPGRGMTQQFSMKELDVEGRIVNIVDSPGLADAETRQNCAEEIEKGLKQGGLYRIIIMVRQQDGRVVEEDKTTLKLILDALPKIHHNQFGILVNQVPRKMMKKFGDSTFKTKFVNSLLSGLVRETKYIRMIESDEDLQSESNVWFPPESQGLQQTLLLLKEVEPALIETEDVEKVHTQAWDKEKDQLINTLKELEANSQLAAEEAAKRQHVIENLQTDMEANQKEFEEVLRKNQVELNDLKSRNDELQRQAQSNKGGLGKLLGAILAPITGGVSLGVGALLDEM